MASLNSQDLFEALNMEAASNPNAPRASRKRSAPPSDPALPALAPAIKRARTKPTKSAMATPTKTSTTKNSTTKATTKATTKKRVRLPSPSLSPPPPEIDASPPTESQLQKQHSITHPATPAEESKNLPTKLSSNVVIWGFVPVPSIREEEREVEKAWIEPPVLKTKYEALPTKVDFLPLPQNSHALETNHNCNTTSHVYRYDLGDHFWGVGVRKGKGMAMGRRGALKVLRVGWEGERSWSGAKV